MGLPKIKQNKFQKRIRQAINTASESEKKTPNMQIAPEQQTKQIKKIGRKPLVKNRSAKITFYLTQETSERFNIAYLKEQLKKTNNGQKRIDKSLILETALKFWLDQNGY